MICREDGQCYSQRREVGRSQRVGSGVWRTRARVQTYMSIFLEGYRLSSGDIALASIRYSSYYR